MLVFGKLMHYLHTVSVWQPNVIRFDLMAIL